MRTEILGVGFDDLTLEEAAAAGAALAEAEGFHYAVTPNPEFLLTARDNEAFRQALLGADLVLAVGVGVTYAAIDQYIKTGQANDHDKAIIDRYHARSEHKRRNPLRYPD